MAEDILNDNTAQIKEHIAQTLEMAKTKLPAKALPSLEEALNKALLEDKTAKEALGMPQSMVEEYYKIAYHLYKGGKFKEALEIFNYLRFLDGMDMRFTWAIAATNHLMKNYQVAAGNYILYESLDPTNPMAFYHLHDCFKKMGQSDLAMNALKTAKRLAENNPRYAELLGKLELEITNNLK